MKNTTRTPSTIDFKIHEPLIKYDSYKEGLYEYIYYLIGLWSGHYRQESILLIRSVAYNYVEFYRQKFEREGHSYKDLRNLFDVGHIVTLPQAYLELARAVADGNYKMVSIHELMLPAEKILYYLYKVDSSEIEYLRKAVTSGNVCLDYTLVDAQGKTTKNIVTV